MVEWFTRPPDEAGYYLVTCAPENHASISLVRSQSYCEGVGSSLAWYNPHNGTYHRAGYQSAPKNTIKFDKAGLMPECEVIRQ